MPLTLPEWVDMLEGEGFNIAASLERPMHLLPPRYESWEALLADTARDLEKDLAEQGRGVLMISSEMPELLGMCDRIYVMNEGRFIGQVGRGQATQERIMHIIVDDKGGHYNDD